MRHFQDNPPKVDRYRKKDYDVAEWLEKKTRSISSVKLDVWTGKKKKRASTRKFVGAMSEIPGISIMAPQKFSNFFIYFRLSNGTRRGLGKAKHILQDLFSLWKGSLQEYSHHATISVMLPFDITSIQKKQTRPVLSTKTFVFPEEALIYISQWTELIVCSLLSGQNRTRHNIVWISCSPFDSLWRVSIRWDSKYMFQPSRSDCCLRFRNCMLLGNVSSE